MARRKNTIYVFMVVIIVLWSINFELKAELDTGGQLKRGVIDAEMKRLQHENTLIEEQILQVTSLTNINKKVREMGFVEGVIIYIR